MNKKIDKLEAHSIVYETLKEILREENLPVSVFEGETRTDFNGDKQISFVLEYAPELESRVSQAVGSAMSQAIQTIENLTADIL